MRVLAAPFSKRLLCVQGEDDVPPRPPLPQLYSHDENPPAVPPLPRETTVIRHTSVRGLKRQSDERKRDREIGQFSNGDAKVGRGRAARARGSTGTKLHHLSSVSQPQGELRPFLSDPELVGAGDGSSHVGVGVSSPDGYRTLPSRGTRAAAPPAFTDCCHLDMKPLRVGASHRGRQLLIQPESVVQHLLVRDPPESGLGLRRDGETQLLQQLGRKPSDFWLEPYFCTPPPPSPRSDQRAPWSACTPGTRRRGSGRR